MLVLESGFLSLRRRRVGRLLSPHFVDCAIADFFYILEYQYFVGCVALPLCISFLAPLCEVRVLRLPYLHENLWLMFSRGGVGNILTKNRRTRCTRWRISEEILAGLAVPNLTPRDPPTSPPSCSSVGNGNMHNYPPPSSSCT